MTNWPLRKPIAVTVHVLSIMVLAYYVTSGVDIPSGILSLMCMMYGTAIGGYAATSTIENGQWYKHHKEGEGEDEQG